MLDLLEPLSGKTVLIVGAGGGIGSFATQLAANAGAHVIANVRADAAERIRGYGAGEIVDHTTVSLVDAVRQAHPDGIDALMDLVSDADAFVALASLVRPRGTAITTQYVADVDTLAAAGVTGINFALQETPGLLERWQTHSSADASSRRRSPASRWRTRPPRLSQRKLRLMFQRSCPRCMWPGFVRASI